MPTCMRLRFNTRAYTKSVLLVTPCKISTLPAMANSLFLSQISNASLSPISFTIGCWAQKPPGEPQLTLVKYIDCKQAIRQIPMGEKALAPVSFGREPDAGFPVPYKWEHGGCTVEIDVLQEGEKEVSTFAAIFKRAFDIAVDCVIKPPNLGGHGLVGSNERLGVVIHGPDPEVSSPGLVGSNVSVSVDTS